MVSNDDFKSICDQAEEDEPISDLQKQYYNIMGTLMFKQAYVDAMINNDYQKLIYFVMKMNVSNTH